MYLMYLMYLVYLTYLMYLHPFWTIFYLHILLLVSSHQAHKTWTESLSFRQKMSTNEDSFKTASIEYVSISYSMQTQKPMKRNRAPKTYVTTQPRRLCNRTPLCCEASIPTTHTAQHLNQNTPWKRGGKHLKDKLIFNYKIDIFWLFITKRLEKVSRIRIFLLLLRQHRVQVSLSVSILMEEQLRLGN